MLTISAIFNIVMALFGGGFTYRICVYIIGAGDLASLDSKIFSIGVILLYFSTLFLANRCFLELSNGNIKKYLAINICTFVLVFTVAIILTFKNHGFWFYG